MNSESELVQSGQRAFQLRYGVAPTTTVLAPGRINLIGDHTDYSGGFAMPCPVNRFVCICTAVVSGPNSMIHTSHSPGEFWEQNFSQTPDAPKDWQKFVWAAVELLGLQGKSFAMGIHSNLPTGLGISSSAALGTGLITALGQTFDCLPDRMEVCHLARQIENDYLGVKTGLLDQMAIVFGKRDRLLVIDFKENTFEYVPFSEKATTWVLISSGVERKLAASGYSQRVEECKDALLQLQQFNNSLTHFRSLNSEHLNWLSKQGNLIHFKRLAHFHSENLRVHAFAQALTQDDLPAAGALLNQSHISLRDDYESSHPEVDVLQRYLIESPACLGARIMGGGFGGSVIGLLAREEDSVRQLKGHLSQSDHPNWTMETFSPAGGLEILTGGTE